MTKKIEIEDRKKSQWRAAQAKRRDKYRKEGGHCLSVMLTPEAASSLIDLCKKTGKTAAEICNFLLVQHGPAVNYELFDESENMLYVNGLSDKKAVAFIKRRVEHHIDPSNFAESIFNSVKDHLEDSLEGEDTITFSDVEAELSYLIALYRLPLTENDLLLLSKQLCERLGIEQN